MCTVTGGLAEDMQSYIPVVCTNSPANGEHYTDVYCPHILYNKTAGKAFCEIHCVKVAELGYPTDLKEFLKSCSNEKQSVDPNQYSKPMKQRVDEELKKITKLLDKTSLNIKSATEAQGTSYLLRSATFANTNNFALEGDGEDCNKLIMSLKLSNMFTE